MVGGSRNVKWVGERETTTKVCGLKAEVRVERRGGRGAVRETNETCSLLVTGHTVAAGGKLFGDGAVTNDHAGDGGRVIRANKDAAWEHRHIRRRCVNVNGAGREAIGGDT